MRSPRSQRGCGNRKLTIGGIIESKNLTLVRIMGIPDEPGVGGRLFSHLTDLGINVEFISSANDATGTANLVLCMSESDGTIFEREVEKVSAETEAQKVEIIHKVATIGIYGPHFRETPEVAAHLFCCLASKEIQVLGVSTSISTVACLVEESKLDDAREGIRASFSLP